MAPLNRIEPKQASLEVSFGVIDKEIQHVAPNLTAHSRPVGTPYWGVRLRELRLAMPWNK